MVMVSSVVVRGRLICGITVPVLVSGAEPTSYEHKRRKLEILESLDILNPRHISKF